VRPKIHARATPSEAAALKDLGKRIHDDELGAPHQINERYAWMWRVRRAACLRCLDLERRVRPKYRFISVFYAELIQIASDHLGAAGAPGRVRGAVGERHRLMKAQATLDEIALPACQNDQFRPIFHVEPDPRIRAQYLAQAYRAAVAFF